MGAKSRLAVVVVVLVLLAAGIYVWRTRGPFAKSPVDAAERYGPSANNSVAEQPEAPAATSADSPTGAAVAASGTAANGNNPVGAAAKRARAAAEAKANTRPSDASLKYAKGLGGTSHKSETLYFAIGDSFETEAAARRRLESVMPLYDVQMYFIVQKSDNFEGMKPGWWVVIESYRKKPDEFNQASVTRGFPNAYVKKATVLTSDPIPVYEDLVPGAD